MAIADYSPAPSALHGSQRLQAIFTKLLDSTDDLTREEHDNGQSLSYLIGLILSSDATEDYSEKEGSLMSLLFLNAEPETIAAAFKLALTKMDTSAAQLEPLLKQPSLKGQRSKFEDVLAELTAEEQQKLFSANADIAEDVFEEDKKEQAEQQPQAGNDAVPPKESDREKTQQPQIGDDDAVPPSDRNKVKQSSPSCLNHIQNPEGIIGLSSVAVFIGGGALALSYGIPLLSQGMNAVLASPPALAGIAIAAVALLFAAGCIIAAVLKAKKCQKPEPRQFAIQGDATHSTTNDNAEEDTNKRGF